MRAYRHYPDYIIKRATSDLVSLEDFLRQVLFKESLWESRLLGTCKRIKGFKGVLHRDNLNRSLKQETLDERIFFQNVGIIIEGESSIQVEDIYQLLRQEAASLKPGERRRPLIAMIISLADSYIHWINKKAYPFLEITNILGPKTFIGFASINLYLIELGFYEEYFKGLFNNWSQAEVEMILEGSFSSLLFGYCVRRLWLRKDIDQGCWPRLDSLRNFLDKIGNGPGYVQIFYESLVLFRKELPQLGNFFDEEGLRMKSFIDTMPDEVRKLYEEVLVEPVLKEYEEKLRIVTLERKEAEKEKERAEREKEKERAEKERAEREKEKERAEREKEKERAEKERAEREKAERELRMTCQEAVINRFPDIPSKYLIAINKLSSAKCYQLLREVTKIGNMDDFELFLDRLSNS